MDVKRIDFAGTKDDAIDWSGLEALFTGDSDEVSTEMWWGFTQGLEAAGGSMTQVAEVYGYRYSRGHFEPDECDDIVQLPDGRLVWIGEEDFNHVTADPVKDVEKFLNDFEKVLNAKV